MPSVSNIAMNDHHFKSVCTSPKSVAESEEKMVVYAVPANSLGGAGAFHSLG